MPVPEFQIFMAPVLRLLTDERELELSDIRERAADALGLTETDRRELVPSGQKALYADRVSWAVTYLKQAGLLRRPERGVYAITDRGRRVLAEHPERVDRKVLNQFEEFRAFRQRSHESRKSEGGAEDQDDDRTPEELLQSGYSQVRAAIESEILDTVKAASPEFFERLVVELLVAMGYGGSFKDAAEAVGRSGDAGIDGVIKEDRLGLDVVLVQAKRWADSTVGRPDIQNFAGSLEGKRARKGIFLTTSSFSAEARQYVSMIEKRIVLIDGDELARLLYDHGVGVTTTATYVVKRVDSDYFSEE